MRCTSARDQRCSSAVKIFCGIAACYQLRPGGDWRLHARPGIRDVEARGLRFEATVMIRRKRSGKRPIENICTKDSYERMCETEPADANEEKRSVQNEREEEEE